MPPALSGPNPVYGMPVTCPGAAEADEPADRTGCSLWCGCLHLDELLRYRWPVMSEKTPPDTDASQRKAEVERQAAERARRSAEQLRANLQRRKAQVRARREGRADETDGLPASGARSATDTTDAD